MRLPKKRNSGHLQIGCIPNGMPGCVYRYFLPSVAFFFDKLKASPNRMRHTLLRKPHILNSPHAAALGTSAT
ncbi:MAG: hypothetical protein FWH18_02365 [Marinilabiliaceae bacterium]|nr:hypothetical protein [Marinilabiliaceae bacterium]